METEVINEDALIAYKNGVKSIESIYNSINGLENIETSYIVNCINSIKQFLFNLYANSISTFCKTFFNWQPGETQEEHDLINKILEKWNYINAKADDEEYRSFLNDLIYFSNDNPYWYSSGKRMYDVFIENFYKAIFEEYIVAAKYYLNKFQKLLEKGTNKYQALIESNFESLDPFEFETFISELFIWKGYQSITTKKTGDYGVDVIAANSLEKIAIQVKKYNFPNKVSNIDVQKILGGMLYKEYKANRAIIITTSGFTTNAYDQAEGLPVELWDSDRLRSEILKNMIL